MQEFFRLHLKLLKYTLPQLGPHMMETQLLLPYPQLDQLGLIGIRSLITMRHTKLKGHSNILEVQHDFSKTFYAYGKENQYLR